MNSKSSRYVRPDPRLKVVLGLEVRQSDGTFDGKNIALWATPLDPDRPGRKTVARTHLEEDGRVLVHRHFMIDDRE